MLHTAPNAARICGGSLHSERGEPVTGDVDGILDGSELPADPLESPAELASRPIERQEGFIPIRHHYRIAGDDGLGLLLFWAILLRDVPVLMGGMVVVIGVGVLGNVVQDISYQLLDPRVDTGTR